jgi:hypothetical protein
MVDISLPSMSASRSSLFVKEEDRKVDISEPEDPDEI